MKAIYIALIICISVVFVSCDKEPIDNDIEGMWRMERFTTHSDGVVHQDCPRIFYSIQLNIVDIAEKQCPYHHNYGSFVGHFYLNGDHTLATMKDFKFRQGTGDTGEDVPIEQLLPYGLNAAETTFDVLKADGKHLVLKSDYATLELTNF